MSKETEQDPHSYHKFADLVNEINDLEVLDAAEDLMNDLAAINNMKQKIDMMEKKLHEGKRAVFYFFTLSLDPEEVALAAQTVKGRKRVITEKLKKAEAANNAKNTEEVVENSEE